MASPLPAPRTLLGDITNAAGGTSSPLKSAQAPVNGAAKASPFRPLFFVTSLSTPRASPSVARARKSARKALLPQRTAATPKKHAAEEAATLSFTPQRARAGLSTEQDCAAPELMAAGAATSPGALQAATPISGRKLAGVGSGRRGGGSPAGVLGWRAPKSPGLMRAPISPGDSSCGGVRKTPYPSPFTPYERDFTEPLNPNP